MTVILFYTRNNYNILSFTLCCYSHANILDNKNVTRYFS
jgi:hypothetical protein